MATTMSVQVEEQTGEVSIHDLVVEDSELVEYLNGFEEDDREEALVRALKVGAATMNLADTEKELEYVRRHFESMNEEFESEIDRVQEDIEAKFGNEGELPQLMDDYLGEEGSIRKHLERAFGEDGIFTNRLDEELGDDGERFQRALDPDREGTPTHRLKQTFKDEINGIRRLLTEEEVEQEVRQKTTLKGEDFEDIVEELLDDLVANTSHSYKYTGDTEGELTGRDVGDFVLDLGDTGQRIVIEAKSERNYTVPNIKEEMEAAMENRLADYGIFVTECASYVPNKVGYFDEFNGEYLAVAVSENEDDETDPRLFRFAFNWAKIRAAQAAVSTGDDVDAETIQTEVDEVRSSIERFKQIKKKCTNIRKSANGIEDDLTEIANDVNEHLNDIQTELSKSAT